MRSLIRRLGVGLVPALIGVLLAVTGTAAQDLPNESGLIVIHGDGRVSFALVQFEGPSLPAVELLHRSGFQVTEVTFGGLGIGVCSIDDTGCDVAECRKRVCQGAGPDDPYWQYLLGGADGSWGYAPLGVSGDLVAPGEVRAFIWSASEPAIPAPSIADVRAKAVDVVGEAAWLTRYDSEGHVLRATATDDGGLPVTGLVAIGVAACCALLIVRRVQVKQ